ncbi:hypothetical protein SAMN05216344_102189 [Polaromonas sp. OV174]|uniref:hypothetical protein n=1 Tax=Polaromonas sp. OV174 TaxID=1855300 RepID=UPI0008E82AAD|nr:hypothetical protein [Polaromonas sp. OV174]SFB74407.1 hypothetical protein SAMN05216344_102189 [Polaromonas sp. OV174]
MLRRTGFKRQAVERRPLPAPRPVRRVAPTVISDKASATPKAEIMRSEAYRRAVAGLPCVICGIAGYSQAAHSNTGKGMALKACDSQLFPACCDRPGVRGCHSQIDQGALFSKAVRRALEPAWVEDTRRKLEIMGASSYKFRSN